MAKWYTIELEQNRNDTNLCITISNVKKVRTHYNPKTKYLRIKYTTSSGTKTESEYANIIRVKKITHK